jgi:cytochrome c oxidase assembly protein subunit 15
LAESSVVDQNNRGAEPLGGWASPHPEGLHRWFRPVALGATVLILGQLILGASMRHQHAGLAVPDFPLAYGEVWPRTDRAFLEEVNRARIGADHRDFLPITAGQIYLHMTHRMTAMLILVLVGAAAVLSRKGEKHAKVARLAAGWFCVILAQAFLGAYTVWSNKAADVATAHVAVGALSLVWGSLLFIGTAPLARVRNRVRAPETSQVLSYNAVKEVGA